MRNLFDRRSFVTLLLPFAIGCRSKSPQLQDIDQPYVGSISADRYGMPATLLSRDTSPGWAQQGQKLLLTGTIVQADGKTPAANVILYYYHTNVAGKYQTDISQKRNLPPNSKGQTHGYMRGWIKTDKDGKYYIYTVRPGTYPSRTEPAHVHLTIKEPGIDKSYYIDDFVFDDDVLLNAEKRNKMENRGGSGVLRLVQKDGLVIGERNIILGLNIPGHLTNKLTGIQSGKQVGEDIHSFTPMHAWGPDKGTRACPICKYGWYHGILYFVGDKTDMNEVKQWLRFLESESVKRNNKLKVYLVDGREQDFNPDARRKQWEAIGHELDLKQVALTFVPSFTDQSSEIHFNKVNPEAKNTILVYKRSRVIDKLINAAPLAYNFVRITRSLDESANEYFLAPENKGR